ncbi:MAG TPA: hypothetical protein DIC34_19535 [Treponema sp.]|nr:MAG: hypothetical protein A2001_16850 [Treponema sp. GWC1_61_84]OHE67230.1 MAG: hypothetical protein A2Y36_08850 [Treponema sp. GWA1_62_8]OHE70093.1 MAG: hypothetical protein A2413_12790 [Treponema sp. RIFOXYC1_FULL_61_9]HCM28694.1 hypothetical protein [Treponema sp.]
MTTLDGIKTHFGNPAKIAVPALAALLALAGCSFGSSDPGTTSVGVAGFAKGVITAKGSIFVNGVEYETSASEIMVDGVLVSGDSLLEVGMIVDLKGTIDPATGKGIAEAVDYSSSIEGTVDAGSIDAIAGTFGVFGLLVQTDAFTVFKGLPGLAGTLPLADNDRVEVSGTLGVLADGVTKVIRASMIKRENGSTEDFKVKGTVSALSGPSDGTFTLTLESGAVLSIAFAGTLDTAIAAGSYVKIEASSGPSGGVLSTSADKIEAKEQHRLKAEHGDRAEASGIVSGLAGTDPVTFTVDGISVSASASLAAGVADGVKVEVKGTIENDVLIATKVKVEQDADREVQGVVTAVDTVALTVTINGVPLKTVAETIFEEDDGGAVVEFNSIDDLAVGDFIEAKTYEDSVTGDVIAVKIERKQADADNETKLKGIVETVDGTTVTIQGVALDLSAIIADADQRAAFLALLVPGETMVKLQGSVSGIVTTWTEIEIED